MPLDCTAAHCLIHCAASCKIDALLTSQVFTAVLVLCYVFGSLQARLGVGALALYLLAGLAIYMPVEVTPCTL
jgi:hypothetical protein